MISLTSKIPSKSLRRIFFLRRAPLSRDICSQTKAADTRTQKLERIADELLSLTKLERYDFLILFRPKFGISNYGPAVLGLASSPAASSSGPAAEAKAAEKTAFHVNREF